MNKQMTKQKEQKTAMQTYRIEFGSDDRLYSVSFKAAIARPELYEMLAAARGSLYENFPEVIRAYLDSHCPENSDFASGASCLEHDNVMADCFMTAPVIFWIKSLAGRMPITGLWIISAGWTETAAKDVIAPCPELFPGRVGFQSVM